MRTKQLAAALLFLLLALCFGCSGSGGPIEQDPPPGSGNARFGLMITDTPPAGVTVLSYQVTVSGATLNPGASLVTTPVTVDVKQLETTSAPLAIRDIPAGNYTGVTLTLANTRLTIKNDGAAPVAGCSNLPPNNVCELTPLTAGTVTIPFSSTQTISGNTGTGALVDINLNSILTPALGIDYTAAGAFSLTRLPLAGQPTNQLTEIDGVLGVITSVNVAAQSFTLQSSQGTFTVFVDGLTTFTGFLDAGCSSANIGCLQVNQIVEADLALQTDGSVFGDLLVLQDRNSDEGEVTGVIVSTDPATGQFNIVLRDSAPGFFGREVGDIVTVSAVVAVFDIEPNGLSVPLSLSFTSFGDLLPGQQVQARALLPATTPLVADRVRLKRTRFTGSVGTVLNATDFTVTNLPAIFTSAGVTTIQAQTSAQTAFEPSGTSVAGLVANDSVSLHGLLFRTAANPALLADKLRKR